MSDADDALRLSFTRFVTPDVGSLAVLLGDLEDRTGIYWLTFADGSEYIGQAVDVVRRLGTHRRHQPGRLTGVAFAPVPDDRLDLAERWMIEQRDLAGAALRNKLITRSPGGPGPMVVEIRPGDAVSLPWGRAERGRVPQEWRPTVGRPTVRQAQQWEELQRHPDWPGIRFILRRVITETMSSPERTAGRLWTISAMPGTSPLPGWRRLCTLTVGRIEAVYIGADDEEGAVVHWNVAVPTPDEEELLAEALASVDPGERIHAAVHDSYSEPVAGLTVPGVGLAGALLEIPVLLDLAYRFNTRYQRQGLALQRRWHNPSFAADLLSPS